MSTPRVPPARPRARSRALAVRVAFLLLVHPELWGTAVVLWARMVPRRWWRSRPFLPVPPRGYLRFRFETAYGHDGRPEPRDVVDYLRWCRARPR